MPTTLVCTAVIGPPIARSLWVSAARCSTRSMPSNARRTSSGWVMSPWRKRTGSPARLSRWPAYVSASSTATRSLGCCSVQDPGEVGPDEPGPPGDENVHRIGGPRGPRTKYARRVIRLTRRAGRPSPQRPRGAWTAPYVRSPRRVSRFRRPRRATRAVATATTTTTAPTVPYIAAPVGRPDPDPAAGAAETFRKDTFDNDR